MLEKQPWNEKTLVWPIYHEFQGKKNATDNDKLTGKDKTNYNMAKKKI